MGEVERLVNARRHLTTQQARLYSIRKNYRWFLANTSMTPDQLLEGQRNQEFNVKTAIEGVYWAQLEAFHDLHMCVRKEPA